MNIIILSRNEKAHFNYRFAKEAASMDIKVRIINPLDLTFTHHKIIHQGQVLDGISLVILRTPPFREEKDYFHLAARMFEKNGVPVINPVDSVEISGNKFYTSMFLSRASMPVVSSVAVRKDEHLEDAVKALGGYPVFLKTIFGTRGIGVIYCPQRETLIACAQTLWAYNANLMVEKFAVGSGGETVRLFVLFDKVLGAARCVPDESEAMAKIIMGDDDNSILAATAGGRSNFHRGGKMEIIKPSALQKNLALEAARILGLEMAGVDIIQDGGKWKVLEVNSSPGIKGLEMASNKNVAKKVVQMIKSRLEK